LIEGVERKTGQDRLLKYWPKTGTEADGELRELWRHERLQVDRVMSYPGAEDLFAGVVAMIETSDAFCIVHEPGPMPLAGKLRTAPRRFWMRSLDVPANRIVLWNNFARLSKALGILHSRGLLHGRIDEYAVFTEGLSEPDFRLGGFEWSLVLGEPVPAELPLQTARGRLESLTYSYAHDWRALASMFGGLVGIDPDGVRREDPYVDTGDFVELTESEIDLLRTAIDPDREDVVESKVMIRRVAALTRELSGRTAPRTGKFLMLFRPNQKMSETIYEISEGTIESADIESQRSFVESDLATGARVAVSDGDEDPERLFVLTDTTSYQLRRFSDSGADTWQVAIVTSIMSRIAGFAMRDSEVFPIRQPIEVLPNRETAIKALTQAGGDAIEWTLPLVPESITEEDPETRTLRLAVLLVQSVEAILRTLEILPIEAVSTRKESGRFIIQIVPRETERDKIATAIRGRKAADVMEKLFDKDDQGVDVDWRISTSGGLGGSGAGDVPARFVTTVKGQSGEPVYEFSAFDVPQRQDALFLRKSGDHGTESLIKRRLRTSRVIEEQRDLVTMFADPRRNLRTTGDLIEKDDYFRELDSAKQGALEALWSTAPTYLVVGPPGVGKTKLVSELLRRKLTTEPAISIIVSAQSHQALDHVLRSTTRLLAKTGTDAIVVRSPGPDGAISTDADIRLRAIGYLESVTGSKLFSTAPEGLRSGIAELHEAFKKDTGSDIAPADRRESEGMRAHTALVLESANLVFSTSTSSDVERLVDEGAQFDWAVIEEAAKATGPDLLAPLALSGRRLFIGDHNQLPPFDSERINSILEDNASVRTLLAGADKTIGPTFYDTGLDELIAVAKDETALDKIRAMAIRVFEPFRALVTEDEARRAVAGGTRRSASSELLIQHRMDPAIAQLISACFYENRLETSPERTAKASEPLPFSFGADFPTSPIVFVDMPHVSRTGRARPVESDRPRWNNPTEVKTVVALLERLRVRSPSNDKPSLAVLAPYRAQLGRLMREVELLQIKQTGLNDFRSFNDDDKFCGTVDSSQGTEADLVIVSLVRNNPQTGVPALGFLRDPRRMNVLLSRAREQLVVVGSLEFLREASRHATEHPKDELSFIHRFLKTMDFLIGKRCARGGPAATIIKANQIRVPNR
jgi:AAA domain